MNTKFEEKLEELRSEFPDHYIEVWTPEDFKQYFNEITEEQCISVVDKLKQDYDAYSGTTIELVEDIVHMITETGDYSSDSDD
jgi:hypothetical protein